MNKSAINYNNLETNLNRKVYKLADVKDKIEKVAFDVVRFVESDNIDDLWQIQHCHDGDYIVAMYEDKQMTSTASEEIFWKALADNDQVFVYYKNTPVTKISLASIGIPADEANLVRRYLPKKLASNKKLVNQLLNQLENDQKAELYRKFPELV